MFFIDSNDQICVYIAEPPFSMTLYARDRARPLNTFKNVRSTLAEADDNGARRICSVSMKISNEDIARFSCRMSTFDTFFLNDSMELIQYSISCGKIGKNEKQ